MTKSNGSPTLTYTTERTLNRPVQQHIKTGSALRCPSSEEQDDAVFIHALEGVVGRGLGGGFRSVYTAYSPAPVAGVPGDRLTPSDFIASSCAALTAVQQRWQIALLGGGGSSGMPASGID